MATAIDPVCKMDVDTSAPPGGQSEHQGTAYYFCAPGCKAAFDKEPEAYLPESEAGDSAGHGGGHDHNHGDGHSHGGHHGPPAEAKKPGFLARLFGRK